MSERGQVLVPLHALHATPTVQWHHIDGPMLTWAGGCHWLTIRERLALWAGLTTVEAIAQKHWPERRGYAVEAA